MATKMTLQPIAVDMDTRCNAMGLCVAALGLSRQESGDGTSPSSCAASQASAVAGRTQDATAIADETGAVCTRSRLLKLLNGVGLEHDTALPLVLRWADIMREVADGPTAAAAATNPPPSCRLAVDEAQLRLELRAVIRKWTQMAIASAWRKEVVTVATHALGRMNSAASLASADVGLLDPDLQQHWQRFVTAVNGAEAGSKPLQPINWYEDQLMQLEMRAGCCMLTCTGVDSSGSLRKCSGCDWVWYCSKTCQKAAWPHHKRVCRAHH